MNSNDIDDDKNKEEGSLAEMYEGFQKRLLEELGIDKMSEENRKKTEEKLEELINTRIVNLIMIYTPEDDVAELNQIIEEEKQEDLTKFIEEKIPDFGEKVASDLMSFRDELMQRLKTSNDK